MSHDTDKLIRQLSLVAFLMAERRPLTARDIKSDVEGYSEMSDEAFARRFYSDRTELIALGVPLHSQRDEFTGEELYTLRSEQYFLPELELEDDELAALQTALHLLEGQFAYAEPLRLALQNLALGRPGFDEEPTEAAVRIEVRDPDYSAEMSGRLTKLENAISKQRTVKFPYCSIGRDVESERTVNPYALLPERGSWYVIGYDHDRDDDAHLPRLAHPRRHPLRHPAGARLPHAGGIRPVRLPRPAGLAVRRDRGRGDDRARRGHRLVGRAHDRARKRRGRRLHDGVRELGQLAGWVLRQEGRARPLDPPELVDARPRGHRQGASRATRASRRSRRGAAASRQEAEPLERPAGPVAPERFGVLQALLAFLLASCGERDLGATSPRTSSSSASSIPADQLDDHLQLLNLVNFGGGCYAVYAALEGDEVYVEKELFGDTFRRPPRLTPLEARAIRLALEFVGPMIAAEAHTPLERVRRKLEETFGEFDVDEGPSARRSRPRSSSSRTLSRASTEHRLVEIEYTAVGEETSVRTIEPHALERELPWWYVHSWDRTKDAQRSFRIDRMKRADLLDETFEPRPELVPKKLSDASTARVLFFPALGRWRLERGALPLAKGYALEELRFGSMEYLVGEILSHRGEAEVIEPAGVRSEILTRAKRLKKELGRRPAKARYLAAYATGSRKVKALPEPASD